MSKKKIVFIGAGGHAKSVIDSVDTNSYEIYGFIDTMKTGTHFGYPIFGDNFINVPRYQEHLYFIAIGNNRARKDWFLKLQELGLQTLNIIDKSALVSKNVKMGVGNFIGKMAIVNADVVIGNNNILNTRCLIEHECMIGNHCHISTNSVINGNVIVRNEVFYGSSAVCKGQLFIGEKSIVGAGSVIIKDVETCATIVGVPGRVIKRGNNE